MPAARYRMEKNGVFVETPPSKLGVLFLRDLRKARPEMFSRARIEAVIQPNPVTVPVGVAFQIDGMVPALLM